MPLRVRHVLHPSPRPESGVFRRAVPDEPGGHGYDYADSFEVVLGQPDTHPAEQWVRTALEDVHPLVRRLIQVAHTRVLRFELGPYDERHILGWRIAGSEHDVLQIEASGPLGRGVIVARRSAPTTAVATTYVFFTRRRSRVIWVFVGPLHRRVAPFLLTRAARTLARDTVRPGAAA